jgi:hypothetical protein
VTVGRYLVGLALLALAVGPLAIGSVAARRRLLPDVGGAAARVTEAIVAVAAALLASEALGFASLLYPLPLALAWAAAGLALLAFGARPARAAPSARPRPERPWGRGLAIAAVVLLFAQWGTLTISALRHGMQATDTLRYHEPVAARFVQEHSIDHLHFIAGDPVNTFLPFNTELLHAAGMLFMGSDVLSPLFNLGWLALALAAAWAVGRARGLGAPALLAVALLLASPLAATQAGSGDNDVAGIALILSALAIALARPRSVPALGLAALAAGLAAGTKPTLVVPALAVGLALAVLAPAGRRAASWGWVAGGLAAGGGGWYLRDQLLVGNFLPWWHIHLGPLDLPAPPRPSGTTAAHYAGDLNVIRHVFVPGLDDALGPLWWAMLALTLVGVVLCLLRPSGREVRALAAAGAAALIAYPFTPNTANGPEGFPVFFAFTVRYGSAALAIGLALVALSRPATRAARSWWGPALLAVGVAVTAVDAQFDARTLALLAVGAVAVLARRRLRLPRQPLAAAAARREPEQDLRLPDLRVLAEHPEVRAQRQLVAAAQRVAGDRGDDRLGDPGHLDERVLQLAAPGDHAGVVELGHRLDVGARGEDPLAAVEDDGADVRALAGLLRRGADLPVQLLVDRVHLRPVEADGAHAVLHLQGHELRLGHAPHSNAAIRRRGGR